MHAQHNTAQHGLPTMTTVQHMIIDAITQCLSEQRDLDAWIEREAALDLARHSDPYGMSKMGDGAYWTQ